MSPINSSFRPLPILDSSIKAESSEGCGCSSHSHDDQAPDTSTRVMELQAMSRQLTTARGKDYWRSLDELADTPEFRTYLETEFPSKHELWTDGMSRRDFIKLMGAGMAMMFFSGCRKPLEKIFPYNVNPESLIPGKPVFYATAFSLGGYQQGVLVENHEGKPTKVEGNPRHPDSLGATSVFMQAEILSLYDPDRSQTVIHNGIISTWESFVKDVSAALADLAALQGDGIRLLTETITSPTVAAQLDALLKKYPKAVWHQYEPLARHEVRAGAVLAFGEPVETRYDLSGADIIVSLDADFMTTMPGHLRYARQYAQGRNLIDGQTAMNRLYVVEPSLSITGAAADHHLPMKAADIGTFAQALKAALGLHGATTSSSLSGDSAKWVKAIAQDLLSHPGRSVVIAGDGQPAAVHALAHEINQSIGAVGKTVIYTAPIAARSDDQLASLKQLTDDMGKGAVSVLLILGGNPIFDAPIDIPFAKNLEQVKLRAYLGLYENETSMLSHWHANMAHALESWADGRAVDGTITIAQPLIAPLYDGKSASEVLSALFEETPRPSHDVVKEFWKVKSGAIDFDTYWKTTLHDGVVSGSALPAKVVLLKASSAPSETAVASALEIVFKPDASVWDGRFANNAWLQELPRPLTKLTWENAALISPATAEKYHLENGSMVTLKVNDRSLEAPVWIQPGQADDSVMVTVGYGRTHAGHVGNHRGFNPYLLRTSAQMNFVSGSLTPTGHEVKLVSTQLHHSVEGRDIIRAATLAEYQRDPKFAYKPEEFPKADNTLYRSPELDQEVGWGMSIDMNLCIGCNACVIGCQSENNISIVGKEEVAKGREMQWIRVDNYYSGDPANPEVAHQPIPCMHCENAPCEPVCPVGATVHSDEGLNEMVYNRCIGTRYCANNCPYKVRRFNFFQYADNETEILKFMRNPDVTVRARGVMEKCTYCVQRIKSAEITAEKDGRAVLDGEVVTACQGACPTQAIAFGNVKDKTSIVSQRKAEPRTYALLGQLGVRPRTTFLAKIRNTNPELA